MASSSPPLVLARTVQLALLFGSRLFQTVMRTALSPIVGFVCEDADLQCGPLSKGSLLSAFSLGYITTQLAGGYLGDRIGTKAVILISTVLPGLLTIASSFSASVSMLWWTQVLMGAAQGPLFPTSIVCTIVTCALPRC